MFPIGNIIEEGVFMVFRTPAELGKILRKRRTEMNLTQAEAAALSNVGLRFLGEVEAGKETISFGKLLRIIKAYGLTLGLEPRSGARTSR